VSRTFCKKFPQKVQNRKQHRTEQKISLACGWHALHDGRTPEGICYYKLDIKANRHNIMSFRKSNAFGRPSDINIRQSEMQRDSSGDELTGERSCSGLRNLLDSFATVRPRTYSI
jgi:hypothetical protein